MRFEKGFECRNLRFSNVINPCTLTSSWNRYVPNAGWQAVQGVCLMCRTEAPISSGPGSWNAVWLERFISPYTLKEIYISLFVTGSRDDVGPRSLRQACSYHAWYRPKSADLGRLDSPGTVGA